MPWRPRENGYIFNMERSNVRKSVENTQLLSELILKMPNFATVDLTCSAMYNIEKFNDSQRNTDVMQTEKNENVRLGAAV